jgi:hypothetical protein
MTFSFRVMLSLEDKAPPEAVTVIAPTCGSLAVGGFPRVRR